MVAASMGRSRFRVCVRVLGYQERVQFAQQGHAGARAGATLYPGLNARKGQSFPMLEPQLGELLRHQARGTRFGEPGFGIGEDVFGDADDLGFSLFNDGSGRLLELLYV